MAVRLPECERNVSGALLQGADFVFVEDVQQKSDFNTGSVDINQLINKNLVVIVY